MTLEVYMEHNLENEKIVKYSKTPNGYNIITTNFRMFVNDKNIHKLKDNVKFGKYVKNLNGYQLIEIISNDNHLKYFHFPSSGYNYSDKKTIDSNDDFLSYSCSKFKNLKNLNIQTINRIVNGFKNLKNIVDMNIQVIETKNGFNIIFPKGTIYHDRSYNLSK